LNSFWRDVSLALRNGQRDYTREPLNRAIVLLAVPMVVEMIMESLFAVVDMFWVSRLGSDAIAIVGLTESVISLIYAVAIGISMAGSAIIARRIGENAPDRAARAAAQVLMLGIGISAALGVIFGYLATDILAFMGASGPAIEIGATFARVMFYGNASFFLIFLINAVFRGAGDAVLAMRTLLLANLLNIALCPAFVFGWGMFPELGLTGAAVATTVGRCIGVLYQLYHLAGHRSRIPIRLSDFQPAPDVLRGVILTSVNGIAQLLIGTTSWIGLFKILATFGTAAVAGYTIAVRIMLFLLLPAVGLAGAATTLVGQNLGARQPDRAEAAVRIAARLNVRLLTVVGLIAALLSSHTVRLFTTDPNVQAYATQALLIVSLTFPIYAGGMCLGAAFNGAGDTWTPTRLNFVCLWLGQIPLAWILADVLHLGPLGVFVAVPTSVAALVMWTYVIFKQGKWKLKMV
jgi:putative MATE family efflux protein